MKTNKKIIGYKIQIRNITAMSSMNEIKSEKLSFKIDETMEEEDLLENKEAEHGFAKQMKLPKPNLASSHNQKQKISGKSKKKPINETNCHVVINITKENENKVDVVIARQIAETIIKAHMKNETEFSGLFDERRPSVQTGNKQEKFYKYTTGREFINTEHLVKFMLAVFNSLVTKNIIIEQKDDGQILILHFSRKRILTDPFMKTRFDYRQKNENEKEAKISIESYQRTMRPRRRIFNDITNMNE